MGRFINESILTFGLSPTPRPLCNIVVACLAPSDHKPSQGAWPLPNRNVINDKNVTKKSIVFLISVFFGIFAFNSARVQQ